MKSKTFPELAKSLRAHAAAGLPTRIVLDPKSARILADVLETYEAHLRAEIAAHEKGANQKDESE